MSNTYNSTKNRLIDLLKNQDHKVIVLKGKWGTGKTRLWRDVNAELYQDSKDSIYVSLFGAKTITELRLRIFKSACSNEETTTSKLLDTGSGILKGFLNRFTGYSIEDGVLLWLSDIVKGKLIVIDDIERKHKSLDIDELLGLLDEYSENHKTRFLILLNTDKLSEGDDWTTLHEKVVDVEITLKPLPSESFDIAAEGKTGAYLAETKNAVEILGINNIRIIRKIINTVNHIINASEIDDAPASRWIPSTVLLTACHYRAIDNPPPFKYIIEPLNSMIDLFQNVEKKLNDDERSWSKLLRELDIHSPGKYEEILQEFLTSGLLDLNELKIQFEKYKKNDNSAAVDNKLREFFENVYWNPDKSEVELLDMAKDLLPFAGKLDYQTITSIISTIKELNDSVLAEKFLNACLQSIEPCSAEHEKLETTHYGNICHPEITVKINTLRDTLNPPLSLIEAVEYIIKNPGWGERERAAFRNSTVQGYEDTLKEIKNKPLRLFIIQHIEWISVLQDENFKHGVENFIAACAKIYASDPTSRLSKIIYRTFDSKKLTEKLTPINDSIEGQTHDDEQPF